MMKTADDILIQGNIPAGKVAICAPNGEGGPIPGAAPVEPAAPRIDWRVVDGGGTAHRLEGSGV